MSFSHPFIQYAEVHVNSFLPLRTCMRTAFLCALYSLMIFSAQAFSQDNPGQLGGPAKKSLRSAYTPADYEEYLRKERNGEIPQTAAPVPSRGTSDILVNNNTGATGSGNFTQSETSILAFGNNVVIGFNDAGSFTGGASKFTGWSYSTDGGATFTDGGTLPTNAGGDAGDPVLARDEATGRIYFATLSFVGNIQVFRSDDNGLTWMAPVNGTPGGSTSEDKEWIAVDNFPGTGNGYVYLITRDFGAPNGIYLHRSTNNGTSFGAGVLIASGASGNVQGAFVAVAPDHSVHAFYFDETGSPERIMTRRSTDNGLTFGAAVPIATLATSAGFNGDLGLTGIRQGTVTPSGFRSNAFPHVAINPVSGNIYVTYNDNPAGTDKADIFFSQSTDGGATWSVPAVVNDDGTTTDQWQPTIAVTPDGSSLGIFYSSREEDTANNNLFKHYGRTAAISGAAVAFLQSFAISDVASLPEFGRDGVVNTVYMGDYNHAAGTPGYFHVVWSDNRDNLAGGGDRKDPNVYYRKVPSGTVLSGPNILVAPLVNFGNVNVGQTGGPTSVAIVNIGDADLTVGSISSPSLDFSTSNLPSLPAIIPSLGFVTLDVSFSPLTGGPQNSSVDIGSDALNTPTATVNLQGNGVAVTNISVTPSTFDITLPVNGAGSGILNISHTGVTGAPDLNWAIQSLPAAPVKGPSVATMGPQPLFQLTDRSIQALRSHNVPPDVLGKLEGLKNSGPMTQDFFFDMVENSLGKKADSYHQLLYDQTMVVPEGIKGDQGTPGVSPDGSGGPDAFGYAWIDSDEPGGPTFSWTDITGTGTSVVLGDDAGISVPLAFSFPFYGASKTSVNVCSNGYLTFGTTVNVFTNTAIPTATTPNDLIAAFWDDLNPTLGGTIHYLSTASQFTVQYTGIKRFGTSDPETFQIILNADGTMLFQYLTMTGALNAATIGVENANASIGLQVVFNAAYVHDNLAVKIYQPTCTWITSASPALGTIPAGGSQQSTITVDANGLVPGVYNCEIIVNSNAANTNPVIIPATLTVSNTTDAPVVNSPIASGSTSVSGTSTEADGTVIDVFVNSSSVGTTTVSGGTWTKGGLLAIGTAAGSLKTGVGLVVGDTVKATATASGELTSAFSNEVIVQDVTVAPVVNAPITAGATSVSGTGPETIALPGGKDKMLGGTIIEVFVNSASVGTTSVNIGGGWTKAGLAALSGGDTVKAKATAINKLQSAFSNEVIVDAAVVVHTFVVTNTNDANAGSLRQAILDANATANINATTPDTIIFNIPGGGVRTITPAGELTNITDPVIIDGTSQPGFAGVPLIQLAGDPCVTCPGNTSGSERQAQDNSSMAKPEEVLIGTNGLKLISGGSTVKGLIINGFPGHGIFILTGGNNVIQGNYIGTDATGTASSGNATGGIGIKNSQRNLIGGTTAAERNIISGNVFSFGIELLNAGAPTPDSNRIQGNYIGTTATGATALSNSIGIQIASGVGNTIGGTTAGTRNIISGNTGNGVFILGAAGGNVVAGNYIGTNAAGSADLGNGGNGVIVTSSNNIVGGTTAGARNIISGNNGNGVNITGAGTGNVIAGNYIGTDATGVSNIGNSGDGVEISSSNNTIGGLAANSGNTIAFNGAAGVFVFSGTGNAIDPNSIFSNVGLGIDLGAVGVTPNDGGDGDAGSNNLQNFPEMTLAERQGNGDLSVTYSVPSTVVNSAYPLHIEFFKADAGEGKTFLGAQSYAAVDAQLPVTQTFTPAEAVSAGNNIVATATDALGNTSEFSAVATVAAAPPAANVLANGDFESGSSPWVFFTNGTGNYLVVAPGASGSGNAARLTNTTSGSNTQFYQSGITLVPGTEYTLTFKARSTAGHDLSVFVHRHDSPYTNYGLNGEVFNLTSVWQTFTTTFTAVNFPPPTPSNARLRFRLNGYAANGEQYFIDDVELVATGSALVAAKVNVETAPDGGGSIVPAQTIENGETITMYAIARTATNQFVGNVAAAWGLLNNTGGVVPGDLSVAGDAKSAVFTGGADGTTQVQATSGVLTPTPTEVITVYTPPPATNLLVNGGFESGTSSWNFNTNGAGAFTAVTPGNVGAKAGQVSITTAGTTVQLYQYGISLTAGNSYRLSFKAFSTTGHDVQASVMKHTSPFTPYGLNGHVFNLTNAWASYTVDFVASGFGGTTNDIRLRFWLSPYDAAGDVYQFDDVKLELLPAPALASAPMVEVQIPTEFSLGQNFPNPFNPSTTIIYTLPVDARVTLEVVDMLGQRIAQLVDGNLSAGYHDAVFDASTIASGMYLYRLNAVGTDGTVFTRTEKMLLMK